MWVSAEEQAILQYLKCCGEVGASAREICRKAGSKDQWKENERWAMPALGSLKDKSLIFPTPGGGFMVPPDDAKKAKLGEREDKAKP